MNYCFLNIICVKMALFDIVLLFKIWWIFRKTRETRCYQLKIVSTLSGKARSRFSPLLFEIDFLEFFFFYLNHVCDTWYLAVKSACINVKCKNGGFCDSNTLSGECICVLGFSGRNCEIRKFLLKIKAIKYNTMKSKM